jgi:hypothetical protein
VNDSGLVDTDKREYPVRCVVAHASRLLVQALVDWEHRNWRLDGFPSGSDIESGSGRTPGPERHQRVPLESPCHPRSMSHSSR